MLPTDKYYWVSTRTIQVYDISIFIPIVDAPFCPGYCLYLFYQAFESFRLNFYFMLFLSNWYLCLFVVSWKCHIVLYFCVYVILFNVVFYYYLSLSFLVIVLLFLFALLFYFYSIVSIGPWPKPNIGPILTHFAGLFSKHQIKPIFEETTAGQPRPI